MNRQKINSVKWFSMRWLCLISLSLLFILLPQKSSAQTNVETRVDTKVFIFEGGTPNSRMRIAGYLSQIIQAFNKIKARESKSIRAIRHLCTDAGYESLESLVARDSIYSTLPEMVGKILDTPISNYFEVRDIRVNLGRKSPNRDILPFKYLVFAFNEDEKVTGVDYEVSEHNRLMDTGLDLTDEQEWLVVARFITAYQNAYNNRDSTFIDMTLSDDAVIIVGRDLRTLQDAKITLERDARLNRRDLQLVLKDKRTYLTDLKRKVFRRAKQISVSLWIKSVMRHKERQNIIGVNLYQKWYSDLYRDKGYLFLMFDFQDKQSPIIHVRSFQFNPFRGGDLDGHVIELTSFRIN